MTHKQAKGPTPHITAYPIETGSSALYLVPASPTREWMEKMGLGFAKRCLPMLIASSSGWEVRTSVAFSAVWDGSPDARGVTITPLSGNERPPAKSWFGRGTMTVDIPWLIKTSPGYNLLVRGPANVIRDGIGALEASIETDWNVASFAETWVFSRPTTVLFEKDSPLALLVPVKRGELESFVPQIRALASAPELAKDHAAWREDLKHALDTGSHEFRRDYVHGTSASGRSASPGAHQTRLHLKPFK